MVAVLSQERAGGWVPWRGAFSSHSLPLPFGISAVVFGGFWELFSAICKLLNQLRNAA